MSLSLAKTNGSGRRVLDIPVRAPTRARRWAVVLAGGEGMRLRAVTRDIAGDDRPKQFCAVLGNRTLLEQARDRAALVVPRSRTLTVLLRAHERFYLESVTRIPSRCVVVQPANRGTAPAVLYALLRVLARAPMDPVALFPTDHYVSDEGVFAAHVEAAFRIVQAQPDLVILLGIAPSGAEPGYGWIERAEPVTTSGPYPVYRVRAFWEKPDGQFAEVLRQRSCLWNSLVVVGRPMALSALVWSARPDLYTRFMSVRPALDTFLEEDAVRDLYERLPVVDFSADILARRPDRLAVLPVRNLEWSDLGEPQRLQRVRARLDPSIRPALRC